MVHEACEKVSSLCIEYRSTNGNRLTTDTQDKLYAKFISIVPGLPEDATKWLLPLCNSYFTALVIFLQDKMEDDKFNMPGLHGLTTKSLQLGALRLVRTAAVAAYKSLNDEEKRLRRMLLNNNNNRGSSLLYEEASMVQGPYSGDHVGEANWLTETMLARYGSDKRNDVDQIPPTFPPVWDWAANHIPKIQRSLSI